jgi:hypothetical protein
LTEKLKSLAAARQLIKESEGITRKVLGHIYQERCDTKLLIELGNFFQCSPKIGAAEGAVI